jgi:hypothetical protein
MKKLFLRSISLACLTSATLLASPVIANDKVVEQIDLGLELYQQGDYGAAITELEFAINDIRKMMSAGISETFPDAPSGWTATEASKGDSGAALMGGGSALTRKYTQDDGNGRMEATLMVDNPMVQGMGAMLNNPALIAAQKNMERIRIGREAGILKWVPERGNAEATLLLDGRILMQVKGRNLADPDPVVSLLRAWDLDALREKAAR